MKATGIIRNVDELGRIVIPKELRRMLGIKEARSKRVKNADGSKEIDVFSESEQGTPLEIFIEGESIILRKYEPFCTFCGSSESLFSFGGKNVCASCAKKLQHVSEIL